jgi:hypothetical protein
MHKSNINKTNSFSAEQIGYFGKPTFTKEELIQSNIIENRMKALGIKVPNSFSSSNKAYNDSIYTKDEMEALKYIYANKAIPVELEQRLIDRMVPEKESKNYDITIGDDYMEEFLARVSKHE